MTGYHRRLAAICVAIVGLGIALLLFGTAREELAPEPRRAHVAIEVAGEGIARVGRVEIVSGTPFTLHAVLEAEDWRGRPVYYTEAPRLELGGAEVPAESLRRWDRRLEARVLWFTVEGTVPYLEVASLEGLDAFGFREVFRADWGRAWSIPGSVLSEAARALRVRSDLPMTEFGTQRFHARVELYGPASDLRPESRYRSAGAESLPDRAEDVPTVVARLEGPLEPASSRFTLSQIEPLPEAGDEVRRRLVGWTARGIAFQRTALLGHVLDSAGVEWEELDWEAVEPGMAGWTGAGTLVRVGARVVLAYRDLGVPQTLDEADLVLDFDRGPRLLRLGDVFLGEGLVERARLASADDGA